MTSPTPHHRTASRRRRVTILLTVVLATIAGCSSSEPVAEPRPVFALDRNPTLEILPLADDRGVVLPATDLRLVLLGLLTEHATLSNEAMRISIDNGDLGPTLTVLTENTDGLTAAIGLVYGPAGANAFDQLWTNHIEFFNRYAAAIRRGDEAEAIAVIAELDHYESDFSDFVDVATGGELAFHDVLHILHSHVEQLLDQADAWHRGDYATAHRLGTEAFLHMDDIARGLAGAISAQSPEAFPGSIDSNEHEACAEAQLAVLLVLAAASDVALAAPVSESAAQAELRQARTALDGKLDVGDLAVVDDILSDIAGSEDVQLTRAAAHRSVASLDLDACDGVG